VQSLMQRTTVDVQDEDECDRSFAAHTKWHTLRAVLYREYSLSLLACGALWSLRANSLVVGAQTQLFATPDVLDREMFVVNEDRNGLLASLFRIAASTAHLVLTYLQEWLDGTRNAYSRHIADSILIQVFQDKHHANVLDLDKRTQLQQHTMLLHERWNVHQPVYNKFLGCVENAGLGRHPAGCNWTLVDDEQRLWGTSTLTSTMTGNFALQTQTYAWRANANGLTTRCVTRSHVKLSPTASSAPVGLRARLMEPGSTALLTRVTHKRTRMKS
jgi:hypothetical protein